MIERFVVECMEMEPEARMGLGELELSSTKELYFQIHKLDIKSQRRTHEEQHKTADNEKSRYMSGLNFLYYTNYERYVSYTNHLFTNNSYTL